MTGFDETVPPPDEDPTPEQDATAAPTDEPADGPTDDDPRQEDGSDV